MARRYNQIDIDGKSVLEHRYVMEQYLGRKLLLNEYVHHINGDKFDNRIENLMVVTPEEHGILHSKYPRKKKCVICGVEYEPYESKRRTGQVCSPECKRKLDKIHASKRKKRIIQMDLEGNVLREWDSARDCMNETGFFDSNICNCCKGKIKSYKGYKWEYAS